MLYFLLLLKVIINVKRTKDDKKLTHNVGKTVIAFLTETLVQINYLLNRNFQINDGQTIANQVLAKTYFQ